jgi:hypothetical protein
MARIVRRRGSASHRVGSRKVSLLPPKRTDASPLRGRDDELARLAGLVSDAVDGHGGAALVTGLAGIGKTSLLGATAAGAGLQMLAARAGALERDFAFGLVRGLLEPLGRRGDLEDLLQGAAALAQTLFVTARTIEVHLTHAYAKLNVAGRGELAAALD